MKLATIAASAIALAALPASAAITVVSTASSGGTQQYATDHFSGISVNVGDVLVVVHAPNKNTTTNTISATFNSGTNTFSSVSSGTSGGQASGWVFYSSINQAGSYNIALDTSNATKTVSHATSYFLLRSDAVGGSLSVIGTAGNANNNVTSLGLSLSWAGTYTDYIALAGAAVGNAITPVVMTGPGGNWTETLDRGPDLRTIFRNDAINTSPDTSFLVTADQANPLAAAGIVVGETVIPEPSAAMLAGLGLLGLLRRRRA